jgi:hypothetical protein
LPELQPTRIRRVGFLVPVDFADQNSAPHGAAAFPVRAKKANHCTALTLP